MDKSQPKQPERRKGTAHVATFPSTFQISVETLLLFAEAVSVDRRN